jgi:hypothetical protein
LQIVFGLPRFLRRKIDEREKKKSGHEKSGESHGGTMGKVLEMRVAPASPEPMYLTGRTLLRIASAVGRVLFDKDGTPVLETEFYQVDEEGIKRVA